MAGGDVIDPFWFSLLAKMSVTAAIVVAASLVAERLGPFLGGMVATLPVSAGPSYIFMAMEHGPDFIERSSLAGLAVNAGVSVFIVAYAVLAQRRGLLVSLCSALMLWALAVWTIARFEWTLAGAVALNAVTSAICLFAAHRFLTLRAHKGKPLARRWWDVPLRAACVMGLVGCVMLTGRLLGPTVAGIAATAPIVLTSLALILHPRIEGPATASVLANGLPGVVGLTAGMMVIHVAAVPFGSVAALTLALAVCLGWNMGLVLLRR